MDLYFDIAAYTTDMPKAREFANAWTRKVNEDAELRKHLIEQLLDVAPGDATVLIAPDLNTGNVRNAHFVSFANPRDLRVDQAWVSAQGSAILDVTVTLDYTLQYETPLPDGPLLDATRPWPWTPISKKSTVDLTFEVLQHHRDDPTRLAAHLVSWTAFR